MIYSFNSLLQESQKNTGRNIIWMLGIGTFSWVSALDYALVRSDATAESPLVAQYSDNLSQLQSPYALVRLDTTPILAPNGITLGNLASTDRLFISSTVSNFSTLFPSQTQDGTVATQFSLQDNATFQSQLAISSGSTVEFLMNGCQLSIPSGAVLSGAGSLSFQNGSAPGKILMNGSFTGLTGGLNINGQNELELQTDYTLTAPLSGTGTIIKKGPGTTTFSSANNNFNGLIKLESGSLTMSTLSSASTGLLMSDNTQFTSSMTQTLSSLNSVNESPAAAARPKVKYTTLIINNSTKNVFAGELGDSSAVNLIKRGIGELVLKAATTAGSRTIVEAGRLTFGGDSPVGKAGLDIRSEAELDLAGYNLEAGTANSSLSLTGKLMNSNTVQASTINKPMSIANRGVIEIDGDVIQAAQLSIASAAYKRGLGTFTLTGAYDTAGSGSGGSIIIEQGSFVIDNSASFVSNQSLSGPGTFIKKGSNNITFTKSFADFTGEMVIESGRIIFSAPSLNFDQIFVGRISGPGILQKTESRNLTLTGDMSAHTGQLLFNDKLILGSNGADQVIGSDLQTTGSAAVLTKTGTNKVRLLANLSGMPSSSVIALGSGTLSIGNDNSDFTFLSGLTFTGSSAFPNFGTLEKDGSNKVILQNDLSNFKGTIAIKQGTLAINSTVGGGTQNHAIQFKLTGTGTLEKMGTQRFNVFGDWSDFNGDILISGGALTLLPNIMGQTIAMKPPKPFFATVRGPGILETPNFLEITSDLSNFTGAIKAASFIFIGNNSLDYTLSAAITGGGNPGDGATFTKNRSNSIRFAGDLSAYGGTYEVSEGRMILTPSTVLGTGRVINVLGGVLELEPGSSAQTVQIRSGGKTEVSRTADVNTMTLDNVNIFSGGTLDIKVLKNGSLNDKPIEINTFNLQTGGNLLLKPDLGSTVSDAPLLNINTALTLPSGSNRAVIGVSPQGTMPPQQIVTTVNLLKLGTSVDTEAARSKILSLLTAQGDYDLLTPSFDGNGVLSCQLRHILDATNLLIGIGRHIDVMGRPLVNTTITLAGGSLSNSGADVNYAGSFSVTTNSVLSGSARLTLSGPLTHNTAGVVLTKSGQGELLISSSLAQMRSALDLTDGWLHIYVAPSTTESLESLLTSTVGSGGLRKSGSGTLTIAGLGNNTYAGATEINEGRVVLAKSNALGQGAITVSSGAALDIQGYSLNNPQVQLAGGTLENSNALSTVAYLGQLAVSSSSTIELNGAMRLLQLTHQTAGATLSKKGTADLILSGSLSQLSADIDIVSGFLNIEVSSGFQQTLSSLLTSSSNLGGLKKSGPGTLILSGGADNTYSGPTQLTGGSIILDKNNALGTGTVSLSSASLDLAGHVLSNSDILLAGGVLKNTGASRVLLSADISVTADSVLQGVDSSGSIQLSNAVLNVDDGFQTNDLNIASNGRLVLDRSLALHQGSVTVGTLTLQSGAGINIRPHELSSSSDLPLLTIATALNLSGPAASSPIQVGIEQRLPSSTPITVNLLKLDGALNTDAYRQSILERLVENSEYEILNPQFSTDGVLSLELRHLLDAADLIIRSGRNFDIAGRVLTAHSITLAGGSFNQSYATSFSYQGAFNVTNSSVIGGLGDIMLGGAFQHQGTGTVLTKIGSGSLVLSGATHTLTAEIDLTAGLLHFDIAASEQQTVSSLLSSRTGAGGLKKSGEGTLLMAGSTDNTYAGTTEIVAGRIVLAKDNALGLGTLLINGGQVDLAGYAVRNPEIVIQGGRLENTASSRINYSGIMRVRSDLALNRIDALSGTIDVQGSRFSVDPQFQAQSVQIGAQGVLAVDLDTHTPQSGPAIIHQLAIQQNAGIALSVDFNSLSGPILHVESSFSAASKAQGAFLSVNLANMAPSLTPVTVDVLRFAPALNITAHQDAVLDLLTQSGDYEILSASFDSQGLLRCQMRHVLDAPDLVVLSTQNIDIQGRPLINNSINLAGGSFLNSGARLMYQGVFQITADSIIGGSGDIVLQGSLMHNSGSILKKQGSGSLTIASNLNNLSSGLDITQGLLIFDVAEHQQEVLNSQLTSSTGTGSIKKVGLGELTVSGSSDNTYAGTTEITQGRVILAKNNALGGGGLLLNGGLLDPKGFSLHNRQIAMQGGKIINTGQRLSYQHDIFIYADSELSGVDTQGTVSLDEGRLIVDASFQARTVHIFDGAIFDLEKDLSQPTVLSIVDHLILETGGQLILRPDLTSSQSDLELLKIASSLSLAQADLNTFIKIEPQAMPKPPSRLRVNLLSLGPTLNTDQNRQAIIALLKTGTDFDIEEPLFSANGLLSCVLKSNLQQPMTEIQASMKVPAVYKTLINKIFNQPPQSPLATLLYEKAAYSDSEQALLQHVRSFAPTGALPSTLYQSGQSNHLSSLVQAQRQYAFLSNLQQSSQGGFSSQAGFAKTHHFFEKMMSLQDQQQSAEQKYEQKPAGLDFETFRHINLDGLSFESKVQYQSQFEPNRSEDEIGYRCQSWTGSIGASYSQRNHYSIGSFVSTTKSHEKMNSNHISKEGDKTDRLNSAGVMGYYKTESVPLTLSALLSYGQHHYIQNRVWDQSLPGSAGFERMQAAADYKCDEITVQSEIAYIAYKDKKMTLIQPFVGFTYEKSKNHAYQEQARSISSGQATDYGYIVPEQSYSSHLYSMGIEYAGMRHINDVPSLFFGRIGVSTQKHVGDESIFVYALAAAPDAPLQMSYENQRYNTADILLGFNTTLTEGFQMTCVYTANIGKYLKSQHMSLSVDYLF